MTLLNRCLVPAVLALAAPSATSAPAAATAAQDELLAAPSGLGPTAPFELPDVLFGDPADDGLWVSAHGYKAVARPDGFTFIPFLGSDARRNWPVHFRLAAVRGAGGEIPLAPLAQVERRERSLLLDRGPVDARYDLRKHEAEQLFLIEADAVVRGGPMVLELEVHSDLTPEVDGDGLRFIGPEGGAAYGAAIAFDADGLRTEVPITLTETGLSLTVPRRFVDRARGPITVDPLLSSVSTAESPTLSYERPDLANLPFGNTYIGTFEARFSSTDVDIFAVQYAGSFAGPVVSSIRNNSRLSRNPAVATINGEDCAMIVWDEEVTAGGNRQIRGRIRNFDPASTPGSFSITTGSSDTFNPDVGGDLRPGPGGRFLAVFSSLEGSGDIRGRHVTVEANGAVGTRFALDNVFGILQEEVRVSEATGAFATDNHWVIAALTEDRTTGQSSIRGLRVRASGTGVLETSFNLVNPSSAAITELDVSSAFVPPSLADPSPGMLFGLVYTQNASGLDTILRVFNGPSAGAGPFSELQLAEHGPSSLSQLAPRIGVTRNGLVTTYMEVNPLSSISFRPVFSAVDLVSDRRIAVKERRLEVGAFGITFAGGAAIATRFDGGTNSWVGRLIWSFLPGGPGGGSGFRLESRGFSVDPRTAVGVNGCKGTVNSTGDRGFIQVFGNRDRFDNHLVEGQGMPPFQFVLLVAGTQPVNSMPVPNSMGRLCIGGSLGRYNSALAPTDADGRVQITIDPQQIPGPSSLLPAQAGDSRYFQLWHRDLDMGSATSNFTNSARVDFQ